MIIIIYFLFAPIYLNINSYIGLYSFCFHRIADIQLRIIDNSLKIDMKILGWFKRIDLGTQSTSKYNKGLSKPIKKKLKQPKITFKQIKNVFNSFKVRKLYLQLDTGNLQLNAILYPVFYGISVKTGKTIQINFLGENELILEIKNNIARIIRAFFFQ